VAPASLTGSVFTSQSGASAHSTRRAPATSVSDDASTRTDSPSSSARRAVQVAFRNRVAPRLHEPVQLGRGPREVEPGVVVAEETLVPAPALDRALLAGRKLRGRDRLFEGRDVVRHHPPLREPLLGRTP
jgi:hypothetical protein